jgi:ferritin-like metal-binding protein YciE
MPKEIGEQLNSALEEAHAIEKQAIRLLETAPALAGDDDMGAIFRAHLLQTKEHERYVAERLEARGASPSKLKDAAMQGAALGLGAALGAMPKTPLRLATVAFAFENLEVATYRVIRLLAERAGDAETRSVAERILEQEEAAAELVAGTFDRALQVTLGEEPSAPVPAVTPIGKPSERPEGTASTHPGPQEAREMPPDKPVTQPADISEPTEADHLQSPEPGHPVGETTPYGSDQADLTHPEKIGPTRPGQDVA